MSAAFSEPLLGSWETAPDDVRALEVYGRVIMTFEPNGDLVYTVVSEDCLQHMHLTYRTEGNFLVTDQASAPGEERSEFWLSPTGELWLKHDRIVSRYVRSDWSLERERS